VRRTDRLTVTVAALAAAVTVVSAPAATAEPSPERILLQCDDLGVVPVSIDRARGSVDSLDPAVRVVSGPHLSPRMAARAAAGAAGSTVSCRAPGAATQSFAVVVEAATTSGTTAQVSPSAGVAFPFQSELAAYLATRSGSVTVSVQAIGGPRFGYTKGEASNVTASIVKVQIMATVMRLAQEQGRALSSWEKSELVPMIRVSDNGAATALWNHVGGGSAVARVDAVMGMTSTHPSTTGAWGLTTTTAPDNVILMNHFALANPVLSDANRAYGLALLGSVTTSQDWGVSAGPPAGTVDLKNGWLPRTDGWHVNSIGFSTSGPVRYSIAVLTHSTSASMSTQVATIEGVSRIVWRHAAALRPGRGDWDLNGTVDVLATTQAGGLLLYPGLGGGSLGSPVSLGGGWGTVRWVGSPGDVNGDGRSDLLSVSSSGAMYLRFGAGPRRFSTPVQVGTGWGGVTAIATVQDFDGNGTKDLLVRLGDGTLWQYSIATNGHITRLRRVGTGWNTMRMLLGFRDFTGDGKGDLLALGNNGTLTPYVSTGTGLRAGAPVASGWSAVRAVAVPGDLTGDGLDDVVALGSGTALSVYSGRSGGSLSPARATGASATDLTRII
jgi:hypothetical protein